MRVVLINPSFSIDSDDSAGDTIRFFPEGLAIIAAALVQAGHDTRIIDLCRQPASELEKQTDTDVFGLTAMINQFVALEQIIPRLRKICPRAKIILGGPLVTSAPELISQHLDFDLAVLGEGEQIIVSLLENLDQPTNSPGKVYRTNNGKCCLTARRYLAPQNFILPQFESVDLDWCLSGQVRKHLVNAGIKGRVLNNLMLSRGCPRQKNCSFCGQFFGHELRCKPYSLVKAEILTWSRAGAQAVRLQDSNITFLPKSLQKLIFTLLREQQLAWGAHTRVDAITPKMLKDLEYDGCRMLCFGIESFSQAALQFAGKGITVEEAKKAIDLTLQAGIKPSAFFIIGLPGETKESLAQAVRFVRDNQVSVLPYILCPIPGTPFFDLAKVQIPSQLDFLRHCANWEAGQIEEQKLFINLTDLSDQLLLEHYLELRDLE